MRLLFRIHLLQRLQYPSLITSIILRSYEGKKRKASSLLFKNHIVNGYVKMAPCFSYDAHCIAKRPQVSDIRDMFVCYNSFALMELIGCKVSHFLGLTKIFAEKMRINLNSMKIAHEKWIVYGNPFALINVVRS